MTPESAIPVRAARTVRARREFVFDAWLDPRRIAAWMFGPAVRDEEVVSIALEPRVGGEFSFVVRRHGELFDHAGEYLELARPERLAFTWGMRGQDPTVVGVDFAEVAEGTAVAVVHAVPPAAADFVERTREGWTRMLDVLAHELE